MPEKKVAPPAPPQQTDWPAPASAGSKKTMTKTGPTVEATPGAAANSTPKVASKKVDNPRAADREASRAASLLKLGQNLEKSGKASAALDYYRRVVKDFAKAPAAKTAAERIKELEKP